MRNLSIWAFITLMLVPICLLGKGGVTKSEEDKTLSPYFFIKSDDPTVDQLPLLSTSADVNIAGVIADVKVTQIYKNDGKRPIEAIYTFPASTRAAVYGMKMTIGERTIEAKIKEREQARQEYEQAKQEGKSASLLEQQRPNVFQMNVANIMPGDTIIVELKYTELLVPTDGVYEFAYPTVVGPRYSTVPDDSAHIQEQWLETPFQTEGEKPLYTFDVSANISAGMPIQEVICPSHKVNIEYDSPAFATVKLDKSDAYGGNRDFILDYRLAGGKIESGLLLFEGEDENFFLMMIQPPKTFKDSDIPLREYIFIMDVSGSMHGYPIDISKTLLRNLIGSLRTSDYFNVLLFAGGNAVMSEHSLPATQDNINKAIQVIEQQQGGGGTELLPALKNALALPRVEATSRIIVIATDGYVTVEREAFDLIRENLGKANLFAFGIGTSVNRFIIEGMAHVGMGEPFVITDPSDASEQADKFKKYIQSPILTQIKADFKDFDAYDIEPISIPDVLAERPIIVFGKWRGTPKGKIVLSGYAGRNKYSQKVDIDDYKPFDGNSALRYLWARHKIQLLSDYEKLEQSDANRLEIVKIGLKYNLLTQYTSFVAIDTEVRNVNGKMETVKQVLPLPEGVSNYAVGGDQQAKMMAMPSSPGLRGQMGSGAALPVTDGAEVLVVQAGVVMKGTVKIGEITVGAGITSNEVRKAIEAKLDSLKQCYVQKLSTNPNLKGKLVLEFEINKDGTTRRIKVASDELGGDISSCIIKVIEKLRFTNSSRLVIPVTVQLVFTSN